MAEVFDTGRFLDEATDLINQLTRGEPGLLGLRRLVSIGAWALDADGVAIIEFGPVSGRIVAASGAAAAVLGVSQVSWSKRTPAMEPVMSALRFVAVEYEYQCPFSPNQRM